MIIQVIESLRDADTTTGTCCWCIGSHGTRSRDYREWTGNLTWLRILSLTVTAATFLFFTLAIFQSSSPLEFFYFQGKFHQLHEHLLSDHFIMSVPRARLCILDLQCNSPMRFQEILNQEIQQNFGIFNKFNYRMLKQASKDPLKKPVTEYDYTDKGVIFGNPVFDRRMSPLRWKQRYGNKDNQNKMQSCRSLMSFCIKPLQVFEKRKAFVRWAAEGWTAHMHLSRIVCGHVSKTILNATTNEAHITQ